LGCDLGRSLDFCFFRTQLIVNSAQYMSNVFQVCCDRLTGKKKLLIFPTAEGSSIKWRKLVEAYGRNIPQV
jgi:hypothetical protein